MSGFDSLNEQLEQLYLEAVKQREEKLAELQKLEDTIAKLSPLYAGKKYNLDILKAAEPVRATRGRAARKEAATLPVDAEKKHVGRYTQAATAAKEEAPAAKTERSKRRIKEETVRDACLKFLLDAGSDSRSGTEILEYLEKEAGLPGTTSFHTRVYSLLTKWVKSGLIVKKDRGIYALGDTNSSI